MDGVASGERAPHARVCCPQDAEAGTVLLSLGMGTNLVAATSSSTGAAGGLQEQSPSAELEVEGPGITQSVLKKTIN